MPFSEFARKYLGPDTSIQIITVAMYIAVLGFIVVIIVLAVQANKQRLTIKETPGMMPMYQRVARYWQ